jgi:hypothetical protein
LQVGRSTVNLWCRQGRIAGARREDSPVGPYWLIPAASLKNFVKPKRGPVPKPKAANEASGANGRVKVKKGGKK